jgi:hypothetical protein
VIRRWRALLGTAVLGLVLLGCSPGRDCTLIGAGDGVLVRVAPGIISGSTPLSLSACINGRCATRSYDTGDPGLSVPRSVPRDANVQVSVRISAKSRTVFTGSTTTHTYEDQPNGPGCEPSIWIVRVTAYPGNRLIG